MTTVLVPYRADFSGLDKVHVDFHTMQFRRNRQSLLSELRCMSGVPESIRSLNQDTLYRLVLPEGKVLQRGQDGLFRGVFFGDKGIEKHAKFAAVQPSLMAAAKTIGSQVLLISIAMQLNQIQKMVENLGVEMHRDRIAEIRAGVEQFKKAMVFQNQTYRASAILNAIQSLKLGLNKTIAELRSRIAEAPILDNRIRNEIMYHLRLRSKVKKAAKVMDLAQESFMASLYGIKILAECYATLGETEAAAKTLRDYFARVIECGVGAAAEKARLVEFTGNVAPQQPWETFIRTQAEVTERLCAFETGEVGKGHAVIEIEFMSSELQGEHDERLS